MYCGADAFLDFDYASIRTTHYQVSVSIGSMDPIDLNDSADCFHCSAIAREIPPGSSGRDF